LRSRTTRAVAVRRRGSRIGKPNRLRHRTMVRASEPVGNERTGERRRGAGTGTVASAIGAVTRWRFGWVETPGWNGSGFDREPLGRVLAPRVRNDGSSDPADRTASGEQGRRTSWACVTEIRHRVRGGGNRQGRGKRRRRTEAGVEARDEAGRQRRAGKWTPRTGSAGEEPNLTGGRTGQPLGNRQPFGQPGPRSGRVLEGERKVRSGIQPEGKPTGGLLGGRRQGPGRKVKGRRRSREARRPATLGGQTLKANATPRRVRP
jgi:hypothetical protein